MAHYQHERLEHPFEKRQRTENAERAVHDRDASMVGILRETADGGAFDAAPRRHLRRCGVVADRGHVKLAGCNALVAHCAPGAGLPAQHHLVDVGVVDSKLFQG